MTEEILEILGEFNAELETSGDTTFLRTEKVTPGKLLRLGELLGRPKIEISSLDDDNTLIITLDKPSHQQ